MPYQFINNLVTTLSADLASGDTQIFTTADLSSIDTSTEGFVIAIGNELIQVNAGASIGTGPNNISPVVRASEGTTAAAHLSGTRVYISIMTAAVMTNVVQQGQAINTAGQSISLGGSVINDAATYSLSTGGSFNDDGGGGSVVDGVKFVVAGGTYSDGFLNINPGTGLATIGDSQSDNNQTHISVDDTNQSITFSLAGFSFSFSASDGKLALPSSGILFTDSTTQTTAYTGTPTLAQVTAVGSSTTGAITVSGNLTLSAFNLVTDTTTGTKIGTATNQKLAAFGSTPIVQPTGDIVTALGNLGWVGSPTISGSSLGISSANLTGQTAANTSVLSVTPAALGTFRIDAYLNVTARSLDVVQVSVTFKDETGTSQTVTMSGFIAATGVATVTPVLIRAASGQAIIVKTALTTGGGTIAYDISAVIQQVG